MALSPEQVKALKKQLLSQIENLPEPKKSEAIKQIQALTPQALEVMLKQQEKGAPSEKGIFRMIVDREVPSKLVEENDWALAVLEINPISKGHIIVIPKKAAENTKKIPKSALSLAEKLSKKIISKLKAKSTEIQTEIKFNEAIINIIPIYDKHLNIDSPRYQASKEELEQLETKLKTTKKPKIERIKLTKKKIPDKDIIRLPRKIA